MTEIPLIVTLNNQFNSIQLNSTQGDLVKKNPIMCLRGLIMVLFCKIHDPVVHCPREDAGGLSREYVLRIS